MATATQTGADNSELNNNPNANDGGEGGDKPEPTARELAMEAISNGNDQRIVDELAAQGLTTGDNSEGKTKPEEGKVKPAGNEDDEQLNAQLDADDQPLTSGLDKIKVRVKVDGVEKVVSVEEMQRTYQKDGSAESRLEQATKLLKEAKEIRAGAVVPPVGVEKGKEGEETPGASKAKPGDAGKEFVSALFEGDEEKTLAALEKLGIGRGDSTLDEAALTAKLTPAIKQQLVVESALDKFSTDFPDVVGDQYLAGVADGFFEAAVADGKSVAEAFEAAGTKTRDWVKQKAGITATPKEELQANEEKKPTTTRDKKLERKEGLEKETTLNTKATVVEEPVQSATDVINEMRKARGQL